MAKYCEKCGKELPEGAEVCPDCGGAGQETDAALFTQITAATEKWKTEPEKKEKAPRTERQKQVLIYSIAAAAFVLIAVLVILYIQPVNRVIRAVNAGEYAQAKELYWSDRNMASGFHDREIRKTLVKAADLVCDRFARHEIDADTAAENLGDLGSIGMGAKDLLAGHFDRFHVYLQSQENMAEGERLFKEGEFLAAREKYLLVLEDDGDYTEAMLNADECLDRYADSVMRDADVFIQSGDYPSAILLLEEGRKVLLTYDVYNEKLDFKLSATYTLLEEALLKEAEALALEEDYESAAEKLRQGMERYGYETEAMTAAEADYVAKAREKLLSDAGTQAESLYAEGKYEEAFALLDSMTENPDVSQEAAEAMLIALEMRFVSDKTAEAKAVFGNSRDTLPDAITLLNDALHIRRLEELEVYRDDISRYLPASLSELEYTEKEGSIFRSAGEFEGLDGVTYTDGWVWGEDGGALIFTLEGNYDLLEGTLAIRRDDEAEVSGYLEILCDGETAYQSEPLQHPGTEHIFVSLDISGCQVLTLRFHNDYSIRTAEDGYCYHGFCGPVITKNLP